jgi:Protein of unknown function (DUF4239)
LSVVLWGAVAVLVAVVVALAGQSVVARLVPMHLRVSANTPLGTVYAALYVLYALSLAFALFTVWGEYSEAQRTTDSEANTVADLHHLAKQFPEPERHQIQDLSHSYAQAVIVEEWPLLGQGRASRRSPQAQALADELVETVEDFEPTTSAEQTRYAQALTLVQDFDDARELRLLESHQGIPTIMWVVLLIGGVLTISFTFFFGIESTWLHRTSIASLTVLVVLILFTINRIEYPFTGDIQVTPADFESALHRMEGE